MSPSDLGERAIHLSVVIPALEAAATLDSVLEALRSCHGLRVEIVVVDGGSTDGTADLARRRGARVIPARRGRGRQVAAGARAAGGDWLLFLHADTVPAEGWAEAVRVHAGAPGGWRRAAVFRFALAAEGPAARRLERIVAWRTRRIGLPYGDQGLLISRRLYDEIGGYRPLLLMEDVDIVRRIGRRRLAVLPVPALTSAARYAQTGYLRRSARNLACLALYFLGVPPRVIARIYG